MAPLPSNPGEQRRSTGGSSSVIGEGASVLGRPCAHVSVGQVTARAKCGVGGGSRTLTFAADLSPGLARDCPITQRGFPVFAQFCIIAGFPGEHSSFFQVRRICHSATPRGCLNDCVYDGARLQEFTRWFRSLQAAQSLGLQAPSLPFGASWPRLFFR